MTGGTSVLPAIHAIATSDDKFDNKPQQLRPNTSMTKFPSQRRISMRCSIIPTPSLFFFFSSV